MAPPVVAGDAVLDGRTGGSWWHLGDHQQQLSAVSQSRHQQVAGYSACTRPLQVDGCHRALSPAGWHHRHHVGGGAGGLAGRRRHRLLAITIRDCAPAPTRCPDGHQTRAATTSSGSGPDRLDEPLLASAELEEEWQLVGGAIVTRIDEVGLATVVAPRDPADIDDLNRRGVVEHRAVEGDPAGVRQPAGDRAARTVDPAAALTYFLIRGESAGPLSLRTQGVVMRP
jgi:hypothetical protein